MKLSIITINYNNAEGVKRTLDSVATQTAKEFEHIIVDGGSSDGSVPVIKSYEERIITNRVNNQTQYPLLSWVSEKDTGIYNAMNKGVRKVTGEYVLMLNSGDYFVDEHVIERILPELDGTDIVQGNIIEDRKGNKYRNRGYGKSDLDIVDVMHGYFLHQASFCRRDLFERYGYFDETYKIGGDTKFFINCLGCNDATYKYVDIDVCNYDMSGVSALNNKQKWDEYLRIHTELLPHRIERHINENEKKIALYDKIHRHKWIWYTTMLLIRIHDCIFGKENIGEQIEKINE